jgi:putative transposase
VVGDVRRRVRGRPAPTPPESRGQLHLDEVFIKVNGQRQYLWRAVDQDGNVLDILVPSRRNTKAATRFVAKLMKKQWQVPRVGVTDKLRSYAAAHRDLMPSTEHRQSQYLNNRAENSHQPTRQREQAMKGFRSPGRAQRFLACFSLISPHFRPRRHRLSATEYPTEMHHRFTTWNEITGLAGALFSDAAWAPGSIQTAPELPTARTTSSFGQQVIHTPFWQPHFHRAMHADLAERRRREASQPASDKPTDSS